MARFPDALSAPKNAVCGVICSAVLRQISRAQIPSVDAVLCHVSPVQTPYSRYSRLSGTAVSWRRARDLSSACGRSQGAGYLVIV